VIRADVLVPAPAQGALAVESRSDSPLLGAVATLDHAPTRLAVTAERAVLAGVRAACTTAIGAFATWDGDRLTLVADLAHHAGVDHARATRTATVATSAAAEELGRTVAASLLGGAADPSTGSGIVPTTAQPNQATLTDTHTDPSTGSGIVVTTAEPDEATALPAGHPLLTVTADSPLIRSYRGTRTRRRPIWMMRQAGRSLPEYRAVRAGTGMLQACLTPDLAAEITCQPVRRHGVDAAIFFSDIMVPLKLAGVAVDIVAGVGPVLEHPVRTAADVDALPELHPDALASITEGVALAVIELGTTPLIGFCGAPFTVASYLVEGRPSRDYAHTLALLRDDPGLWHALAAWVARTAGAFLRAQVLAGASAVQLFDSWIGALSPDQYRDAVQRHSADVLAAVADLGVPRVHFGTRSRPHLVAMHQAGADVMGVDANTGLDEAAALLPGVPLQGNLDPALLGADWDMLSAHVLDVLAEGAAAPAHVVNLGHGVPPDTDPDVLTRLVALVHDTPDEQGVS
jgi:uroporphyrinogen decarboxylase